MTECYASIAKKCFVLIEMDAFLTPNHILINYIENNFKSTYLNLSNLVREKQSQRIHFNHRDQNHDDRDRTHPLFQLTYAPSLSTENLRALYLTVTPRCFNAN